MMRPIRIGNIYDDRFNSGFAGNVWDADGICPAIMTMQGGGRQPMILEVREIGNIYPSNGQNGSIYSAGGLSPTILSGQGQKGNGIGSCNSPKVVIYEDNDDPIPSRVL